MKNCQAYGLNQSVAVRGMARGQFRATTHHKITKALSYIFELCFFEIPMCILNQNLTNLSFLHLFICYLYISVSHLSEGEEERKKDNLTGALSGV